MINLHILDITCDQNHQTVLLKLRLSRRRDIVHEHSSVSPTKHARAYALLAFVTNPTRRRGIVPMDYYEALAVCISRYRIMSKDQPDLLEFITEFEGALDKRYPLMKLNRWLGYIQGTLIARGIATVSEERDFTRPYFRPLDFE